MRSAEDLPNRSMPSINSACEETDLRYSRSSSTRRSFFMSMWTSIMSARMRSRVTAERRFLLARTMFPRFTLLQGSLAKSLAELDIISPVFLTSSTVVSISVLMSGFSMAIISPFSTKFAVALSTAATRTCARLDLPFFFCGDFEETKVVTCITRGSRFFSTLRVLISRFLGFHFNVRSG